MGIYGAATNGCRSAAGSASSTVPITRRCWSCACIANCSTNKKIPPRLATKHIWQERFEDIAALERYASRNGTVIRKFFLNVSKQEQKKRFLDRLDQPEKNWKFSAADLGERRHWPRYQRAYEDMIRHTATDHAPWYVVPADHKWFTRLAVASVVVEALESLKLEYPKVSAAQNRELAAARAALLRAK